MKKRRLGLHAALQFAVDELRILADFGERSHWKDRVEAAQVIRDFIGRKRLASKLSMRKIRRK